MTPYQKARTKFLQAYEGNMMVSGEGEDIWYQRLWRQLESETLQAIIAAVPALTCYRCFVLISLVDCMKIAPIKRLRL
ncbi:exonuclease V subunit [Salmonella enterica subsp. enterica]|uniref:Exonuclease V subunit n=1 Tax=Salmonella enterica I TaxID=59201 RepID=A0A379WM08_SALET|nr:exonuclease V subunit [Salmonella enterica subsp. enterica]